MRAFLFLSSMILLAGCSNLSHLQKLNPQAGDFQSALAAEYLAYGQSEKEQGRPFSADYFAGKGVKAQNGDAISPEKPDGSQADAQKSLAAYEMLSGLLDEDMKRVAPQKLARAQLLYDCWQHQLSRKLDAEKAPCADEFQSTVADLKEIADTMHYNVQKRHALHFAPGGARLTGTDQKLIRAIAAKMKKKSDYLIEIGAVIGSGKLAPQLAEKRLGSAHKALVAAGIPETHIQFKKEEISKEVHLSGEPQKDSHLVTLTVKTHDATLPEGGS